MSRVMPVDFQGEAFRYILEDMTADMNTLLRDMDDMGSSDGKFTLTISVHLEKKDWEGEPCVMPEIKHKIKSGFNVSHQTDGQMDGEYALKKNEDGDYELELLAGQMSIYDEDDEDEDFEDPEESEED